MPDQLSLQHLLDAGQAGGPSALTETTPLVPAGGTGSLIAPAKYATDRAGVGTYVFDRRYVEGEPVSTVLIDSRTSQANRLEEALVSAIRDGHPVLAQMPRIEVRYQAGDGQSRVFSDLELPHRYSDGHVRAGTIDGEPVTAHPAYRAARDASAAEARALLDLSPVSLVLGAWDATRKKRQGRYASSFVGEIVGVLADQTSDDPESNISRRSGARVDPVITSVQLTTEEFARVSGAQAEPGEDPKAAKSGKLSGSALGLGAIPPAVEALDGVATRSIERTSVLSFATLRRLRFGGDADQNAAIRAVLAAVVINGLTRANSELFLRANCHLQEDAPPMLLLDQRMGQVLELEPLTIKAADALLADAFQHAQDTADLRWTGQIFAVTGNPDLASMLGADEPAEQV